MSTLFALLVFASIACLLLGLIEPRVFSRIFKTNATRGKLSLIFVGAIILFSILAGATAPKTSNNRTQTNAKNEQDVKQKADAEAKKKADAEAEAKRKADEEAKAKAEAEASKPKQWVNVIELKGATDKRSDTFELMGGKTKMTYKFNGGDMIFGSIYILKEGHDLMKEGGFPEVTVNKAGEDSTFLSKDVGKYFLDVKAANTTAWTIKIEEER